MEMRRRRADTLEIKQFRDLEGFAVLLKIYFQRELEILILTQVKDRFWLVTNPKTVTELFRMTNPKIMGAWRHLITKA